jgi:hypothetical protein
MRTPPAGRWEIPIMKKSAAFVCAALAALLSACVTQKAPTTHWSPDFVSEMVGYQFLGYQEEVEGQYSQQLKQDWNHIGLTLRRHLLNDNPTHPLQSGDKQVIARPQAPKVEFALKRP